MSNNYTVGVLVPPDADIVFTSLNSYGGSGHLTEYVLENSGIDSGLPDPKEVDKGFHIVKDGERFLVFVVAVIDGSPGAEWPLKDNLSAAMKQLRERLSNKQSTIWMPLMGTGAGALEYEVSGKITRDILDEHSDIDWGNIQIALPGDIAEKDYQQVQTVFPEALSLSPALPEEDERIVQEFLSLYPLDKLPHMTLEEYSSAGSQQSFTYMLEFYSASLGGIGGGSSFKFGIFNRKDKTAKQSGKVYRYNKDYGWYARFGYSQRVAFETIRAMVLKTAQLATTGRIEDIVDIELDPRVKWKIAFLYQNFHFPCVVSLYKKEALRKLAKLSVKQFDFAKAHRVLVKNKPPQLDISTYSDQLWNEWKSISGEKELEPQVDQPEELSEEEEVLELEKEIQNITPFSADNLDSPDALELQKELKALASAIAYKKTSLPLAIGIFGEWGSGKSFYMKKLQEEVDSLGEIAQKKETPQALYPFYKHIVSVEFNAWHYVESDLWASLAQNIYQQLYEHQNADAFEDEYWLNVIKHGEQQARQWDKKISRMQGELSEKITKLREQEKERENQFLGISVADVCDIANQHLSDNLPKEFAGFLSNLESSDQTLRDLSEAKGEIAKFGAFRIIKAAFSEHKLKEFASNSLVILLIITLFLALLSLFNDSVLSWLKELGSSLFAVFTLGSTVLATYGKKIISWWRKVEKIKSDIDSKIQDGLKKNEKELGDFDKENDDYLGLLREKNEIEYRITKAKKQLNFATPDELIKDQITRTISDNKYGQYLGLPDLLNRDFEDLAEAIAGQNKQLEDIINADDRDTDDKDPIKEKGLLRHPVNRIVLYIDDLDRCPPEVVIKVLEAVKLFLAKPLFVVVLGVDPRWLFSSLQNHYSKILKDQGADFTSSYATTPEEYLEKIFQIPIWLQRPDTRGVQRMLSDIVGVVEQEQREEPGNEQQASEQGAVQTGTSNNNTGSGHEEIPGGTTTIQGSKLESGSVQRPNIEDAAEPQNDANPMNSSDNKADKTNKGNNHTEEDKLNEELENKEYDALRRAQLNELSVAEVEFMDKIAPLLGRSPRALKRYVNIYRIIKSSLPETHAIRMFGSSGEPEGYKTVCFLLAIVVAWPRLAPMVFTNFHYEGRHLNNLSIEGLLLRLVNQMTTCKEITNTLITGAEPSQEVKDVVEKEALLSLFQKQVAEIDEEISAEVMDSVSPWLNIVARYSYSKLLDRNKLKLKAE